MERIEGEEGEREAVRKRMERKGEKGSEEDDYFNKFPPTMPSVVLENRLIRMFKVSYRSAPKRRTPCPQTHSSFIHFLTNRHEK